MDRIVLNMEIAGCLNHCFHCHCHGGEKERGLMSVAETIALTKKIGKGLGLNPYVLIMQEQTYYPEFFELVTALEEHGFLIKGNQKPLITNCWGLANCDGFVERLPNANIVHMEINVNIKLIQFSY